MVCSHQRYVYRWLTLRPGERGINLGCVELCRDVHTAQRQYRYLCLGFVSISVSGNVNAPQLLYFILMVNSYFIYFMHIYQKGQWIFSFEIFRDFVSKIYDEECYIT